MPPFFQLQRFNGPLDLLLSLIQEHELSITEVSLAEVTDQYLRYLEEQRESLAPEEVADFLLIASKLLLLKSKALLPDQAEEAEEDASELTRQLKMYRLFLDAMKRLDKQIQAGHWAYPRQVKVRLTEVRFRPPEEVSADILADAFRAVLRKLTPLVRLSQALLAKAISLQERIEHLRDLISRRTQFAFQRELKQATRSELVVSFIALLELVKQRFVFVEQAVPFEEIVVRRREE